MDRRAWSWLFVLGAIWGASYLLIKIGLRDLSPEMVSWARIAFAAAVLVPIAARTGALRAGRDGVGWLVLLGAVQVAAPFVLISAAEQEISSSLTGILVTSAPLFTALLAIWIDHEERSQGMRMVGIGLGVLGVAVLLGVDLGGSGSQLLGGLAVLLAGLGYAVGGFLVKRRFVGRPPIGIAAWVMIASTVLLAPFAAASFPSEAPGVGPVAAVAALGVIGTGIAFAIFYTLMGRIGPARTFIVTYLAPGFAVVYGAAFLDEVITAVTLGGLALILLGSWLAAEGRTPLRRRRIERPDGRPAAEQGGGSVPLVPDLAAERVEGR